MNLLRPKKRIISTDDWKVVPDYRAVDHVKVKPILQNMMDNIKKVLPTNFEANIELIDFPSSYLMEKESYYEKIKIHMVADEHEQKIELLYPKLIMGNYFVMNGSLYVPILFLERSPIDVLKNEKKGNKYFINLIPTFNLTLNFKEGQVLLRRKSIEMGTFIRALFHDDLEYYTKLINDGIIEQCTIKTDKERDAYIYKNLGFHESEFFEANDLRVDEFFDNFIILDYFKGMFNDFFGIDNIKDIIKIVINYYIDDTDINMSDIQNRRIVMNEYLINPLYEMYLRLLYGAVDKNEKQQFLPTMNQRVLITSGFRGLMHAGQYYNISLPYTNPIINKTSQDIYIINDGRVPKSWTSNHESAMGKLCPISVSAQNMGSNLVFTNDTRINKFGRIE